VSFAPTAVAAEHVVAFALTAVAVEHAAAFAPTAVAVEHALAFALTAVVVEHAAVPASLARVCSVADGLAFRLVAPAVRRQEQRLRGSKIEPLC